MDSISSVAAALLIGLASTLGVEDTPKDTNGWEIGAGWERDGQRYVLKAKSSEIINECATSKPRFVQLPHVIHGAHEVLVDDNLVFSYGDPNFDRASPFYTAPRVECAHIAHGKTVQWRVYSYTRYFARIQSVPYVVNQKSLRNIFSETVHIAGAGASLLLAIFSLVIFYGKIGNGLMASVVVSAIGFGIYFLCTVGSHFGIEKSMLTIHKMADTGLWLGVVALMNALRIEGLIGRRLAMVTFANIAVGMTVIIFSSTGDSVQLGTFIPFGLSLIVLTIAFASAIKHLIQNGSSTERILQIVSLGFFVVTCFNDSLFVTGLGDVYPLFPLGFVGGLLFFALSVNNKITAAYMERDYLRSNLEVEVEKKTEELVFKTNQLQAAMSELKLAQGELVQTAKLASLGTLSAGIAHEINNSLNYVNGALIPLEKILVSMPESNSKAMKLITVMKEGLALTFEIISSLRNYTGLNQAKFKELSVLEVVNSVLAILRGNIKNKIEVKVEIEKDLKVYGSVVGLNQVFMNIISNAIDSMPNGGEIRIAALKEGKNAVVSICDSGAGMPKEVIERIFDPFFTTKDVGKGTGLGLHIVKTEVEKHHGKIKVESVNGQGTTFHLILPMNTVNISNGQAA